MEIDKNSYVIYIFISLFNYIIPILNLFIWKIIINDLIIIYNSGQIINRIWSLLFLFFVLQIMITITSSIKLYIETIIKNKACFTVDKTIMNKTLELDIAFYDRPENLDQIQAAKSSSDYVTNNILSLTDIITSIITIISAIVVFISYDWLCGLLFLLTYLPGAIISYENTKKIDSLSIDQIPQTRKKDYYKQILIGKNYAKELRVYNLVPVIKKRYIELWNQIRLERNTLFQRGIWKAFVSSLLTYSGIVIIIIISILNILSSRITVGDFALYIGLVITTGSQLKDIIDSVFVNQIIIIPRVINLCNFLNQKPCIATGQVMDIPKYPVIEFKNVCFSYPNCKEMVIKNLSFKIQSHEKVALIGINGSGKSTIVKLLLRFYDVDSGDILIGGRNIKEYSQETLHQIYGICFQDVTTYALSLRENIALSNIDNINNTQDVETAAKLSGVNKIYRNWENGISTQLTREFDDKGDELSGGQWQKVALARTFFRPSEFYILDEPSSVLDPEAEDFIFTSFKTLCRDKGGLLISHRLSSVIMVDKIMLIEEGRIIETGSHQELMQCSGKYAMLYQLQAEKYTKGVSA